MHLTETDVLGFILVFVDGLPAKRQSLMPKQAKRGIMVTEVVASLNIADDAASPDVARKVLLVSLYNAIPQPWYGVAYEFLKVIAEVEAGATIAAPEPEVRFAGLMKPLATELSRFRAKAVATSRRALGRASMARMRPVRIDENFDLCFYMCQFPREIPEIDRAVHWRRRSKIACAFILETWRHTLSRHRANLRLLDRFDHVFVLNAESIPFLRQYTTAPISFLPPGADCLAVPETAWQPERSIDFLSLGRRTPSAHAHLRDFADSHGKFYVYDVWGNMRARDWSEVRRMNADFIRRSRYFTVWDPASLRTGKTTALVGQSAISTRYFEGAAGGAILLGSRPQVPEFDQLFDWPDAVVDLPDTREDMWATLRALDADPQRRERIGLANRTQSLRRHDWAYRWAEILSTLGLPRTSQLAARLAALQRRAALEERRVEAVALVSESRTRDLPVKLMQLHTVAASNPSEPPFF